MHLWRNVADKIKQLLLDDRVALFTLAILYTVVFSYFSYLRFVDFFTTNWDMGINEQMLWTSSHGYLLFETGDNIFYHGTVRSFLQIHSTYIALPISLLYSLLPSPITLFVIQSLVFSFSIVPLYLIGRDRNIPRGLLYAILICYLLSFGAISSTFYDYHWESFIPLEFLAMFYLLSHKKYLYSLVPLIVGSLTLEVFPFLAAFIVVYFMWTDFHLHMFEIHKLYKRKGWLLLFGILCIAGFTYVAIRFLQYFVIPAIVSVHISSSGDALGSSIYQLFIPHVSGSMPLSISYWLLIYASFGFIPLLYPRHLILQIPWIYSTIFLNNGLASYFGNQYAFVAIPPAVIGLMYSIEHLVKSSAPQNKTSIDLLTIALLAILCASSALLSRVLLFPGNMAREALVLLYLALMAIVIISSFSFMTRRSHVIFASFLVRTIVQRRSSFYVALTLIIAFNLFMSPLNIENASSTPMPGYSFSFDVNPAHTYMPKIVSLINGDSTVLASDNLFPYVANNPNAYSVPWFKVNSNIYYPFNSSSLPRYVLVDSSQISYSPSYIITSVFNASIYGLRAFVYDQNYPGSIYLFDLGYSGHTLSMFVTHPKSSYYFFGNDLRISESGMLVVDNSSKFGVVINSKAADSLIGNNQNIWYGPYYTFPAGQYLVNISLRGYLSNTSAGDKVPILYMNSNGVGSPDFYSCYVYPSQLNRTHWTTISFLMNMTEPFPNMEFRGYLTYSGGSPVGNITLNYIKVETLHLF